MNAVAPSKVASSAHKLSSVEINESGIRVVDIEEPPETLFEQIKAIDLENQVDTLEKPTPDDQEKEKVESIELIQLKEPHDQKETEPAN